MKDNALIALIISTMQTGLTAQGIAVGIEQNYQPTQQGAPSTPYIILHKIFDHEYGSPEYADTFDVNAGIMTHTETQNLLTTFQIGAVAIQNPADTASLTAADYVKAAARTLQTQGAIVALVAAGVGIQRITDIRQTFFRDEKGLNEASPSFDVIFSHSDALSYVVPATATVVPTIFAA